MNPERENLGIAYLATCARLMAARARRAQIENEEIVYQSDAHPLLREGVSETTLSKMFGERKIPNMKVTRRLRHPEKENELRAECVRLDALIAEQEELQHWLKIELQGVTCG